MPGLTAKVFRTYNASVTMEQQLGSLPAESIIKVKELEYNRANREVAVLCNHQRTVSAAFGAQYAKMESKVWKLYPFARGCEEHDVVPSSPCTTPKSRSWRRWWAW